MDDPCTNSGPSFLRVVEDELRRGRGCCVAGSGAGPRIRGEGVGTRGSTNSRFS